MATAIMEVRQLNPTEEPSEIRDSSGGPPAAARTAKNLLLEGLVIVLSILLAFAIDAGWDELRDREQERRLLLQLSDELDLFLDNLGPASLRVTDRVEDDIGRLLDYIHGSSEMADDEWIDAVSWLHRAYEFSAATPVIDLLTADGGLQLISDPEIRKELSNVSSLLGVVNRFEELQGAFIIGEMIPWLNRNVDRYAIRLKTRPDRGDGPSSRFQMDRAAVRTREFSNLLIERQRLLNVVALFRRQSLDHMSRLREMVGARLSE